MYKQTAERRKTESALKLLKPVDFYLETNDWMFAKARESVIGLCDLLGVGAVKSDVEASVKCLEIVQLVLPGRRDEPFRQVLSGCREESGSEKLYSNRWNSYYPPYRLPIYEARSVENRKYVFTMSLFKAIYDTHCFGGRCEEDSVREKLCGKCEYHFLSNHRDSREGYCDKCWEIVQQYRSRDCAFCLNCVKNRFVQAYNNLCYYVQGIDQCNIADISILLAHALSILMYKLEVIENAECDC